VVGRPQGTGRPGSKGVDIGAGGPGRDLWKICGFKLAPKGFGLHAVARVHVERDAAKPRLRQQQAAQD
jgi:hypothetical protein